jgi:cytochrome b involved in lipid metabolism
LGCVVYGRVAGNSAAKYLFDNLSKAGGSGAGAASGAVKVNVDPKGGVQIEVQFGGGKSAGASATTAAKTNPVATAATKKADAAKAAKKEKKVYSLQDVAKHNNEKDCWVVVNGEVLDVTHFLKDHPGGKKAILLFAGKDATEEFNMLHKPDVVSKYAPETIIGTLKGNAKL